MERTPPTLDLSDRAYCDKLHLVMGEPLYFNAVFKGYRDLELDDANPTPLDPDNVFVNHSDLVFDGMDIDPVYMNYLEAAEYELSLRLREACAIYGLPDSAQAHVEKAIMNALHARCVQNAQSMMRLKKVLYGGGQMSDEFLDIVARARNGTADFREVIRLVKEVPEMISAELFKLTRPFDRSFLGMAEERFDELMADLATSFWSAELVKYDQPQSHEPYVDTQSGTVVKKDVLYALRSETSDTQIVRKTTYWAVPVDVRLPGGEETILIESEGSIIPTDVRLVPLSVSYYARAADYKERLLQERPFFEPIKLPIGMEPYQSVLDAIGDKEHIVQYRKSLQQAKKRIANEENAERGFGSRLFSRIGRLASWVSGRGDRQ